MGEGTNVCKISRLQGVISTLALDLDVEGLWMLMRSFSGVD